MRSHRSLISALLALAVLAGQWVCAVHESDHALQNAATTCATCAAAHGAGAGVLPAAPAIVIAGAVEAPVIRLAATCTAVTVRLHPIRGPPTLLA